MARTHDRPDAFRRRLGRLCLSVLAVVTFAATPVTLAWAQGGASAPQAATPVINTHPTWSELSPAHQRILAPLEPLWNSIPELNRHKWVRIAERYPKYSPEEQQRLQTRMAEWVKMTPQQRRLARENYQITRSLPPEKKAEAWNRYQQLPEEQKKKLAAADKVPRRPGAVSALPSGKRMPPDTTHQLRGDKKTAVPASAPASAPAAPQAIATAPAAVPAPASAPMAPTPVPAAVSPPAAAAPLSPPVTGEASTDFSITAPAENR